MEVPENLGEHTCSLLQAELITPIIPGMLLDEIPEFEQAFSEYLDGLGSDLDTRRRNFRDGSTTQVHVEKVGALESTIREFGLCRGGNDPNYSPCYEVESETAEDFMAYLAASLGRLEYLDFVPVTDKRRYWEPLLRETDHLVEHGETLSPLRLEVLRDILPAPRQPLSPDQIRCFKDQHGQQLVAFRQAVEREILTAATIPDPELRARRLQLFREEVDEQVTQIKAHLSESGYEDIVFGKLLSVMACVPGVPFVFGLASAVYNAFQKSPENEPPSPLAYAAYAQVKLLQ